MILQIPSTAVFIYSSDYHPIFCPSDYLPMLFLPAEPPPPGTALNHPGKFGHPGSDPGDLLGKLHRPGKDLRHPFGRQHCFPGSRGALPAGGRLAHCRHQFQIRRYGQRHENRQAHAGLHRRHRRRRLHCFSHAEGGPGQKSPGSWFFDGREQKTSASPVTLLFLTSLLHFILALQLCFAGEGFSPAPFLPYALMTGTAWVFFLVSRLAFHRAALSWKLWHSC